LTGGFLTDYLGYYTTMWVCALITCIGAMIALILLPETRPVLVSGVLKNAREIHLGVDTSLGSPLYHALHSSPFRRKSDAYRFAFVVGLRGVNRFIIAGILSATLSLLVRDYLSGKGLAIGIATLTGVLMASRTVMSILGAYIAGFISDFLRNRWGVLMSGIALSVMSMVFLSSRFSVIIVLGIAMIALARGSMQSMTTSLTGDLTSVSHRGKAVGLLHTVGDLGSAIGPPVAFYLFPLWGLSHVYLLCAGIFGLSLVVNLVLLRFTDVEKVSDH
jgi:MFS family permease